MYCILQVVLSIHHYRDLSFPNDGGQAFAGSNFFCIEKTIFRPVSIRIRRVIYCRIEHAPDRQKKRDGELLEERALDKSNSLGPKSLDRLIHIVHAKD
jgi:hypothetical protein